MTTSRALYAAILILIRHPDVQSRAQQEISTVIGSRSPSLDDRIKCPYNESLLLEVLRYITHAPLGLPHETYTDSTLCGYEIPKGTTVCNVK